MSSEYSAHEAKRLAKQVLLQAHNGRLQYDIATGILLADTDKCEVLSIMELDHLLVRAAFLYHAALMDKAFYQWRAVRTTTAGTNGAAQNLQPIACPYSERSDTLGLGSLPRLAAYLQLVGYSSASAVLDLLWLSLSAALRLAVVPLAAPLKATYL